MSDSEEELAEKQLKIVFVGEPNVGKTSIVRRFCYEEFSRQYVQTIGADFYIKRVMFPERQEITLRITDLGGAELNGHMLSNYFFKCGMIILVYDITNSESFDNMRLWYNTILKSLEDHPIFAVIGNRCDLEHQRAVRLDKTKHFVDDYRLLHFLVSAKTGENVNTCIMDFVSKYFNIPLSRVQKEHQQPIVRAELVPPTPDQRNHIIEKYTENIRFCIICNYLSKIIPALQSRCTRFRFGPLSPEQILPRLNYVVDEEKVQVTEDGKQALLTLANGDMRKVLNVLQSTWLAYKNVTEDNVYTCVGHPLRSDIENIVKWLLNDEFKTVYNNIKELKTIKGLALSDILTETHKYVHRIEFPFDILIELLNKMADIEMRLASGANENIQLATLISAFQHAKDIQPVE